MNEKLQYASMLDLPVNTCNITFKTKKKSLFKKRPKKKPEDVKQELLNKVNALEDNTAIELPTVNQEPVLTETPTTETIENVETEKKKKNIKFNGVTFGLVVVGALIAVILLTNAFMPNSGINALVNSVFNNKQDVVVTDSRTYQDFAPTISFAGSATEGENGLVSYAGEGSVYSVADGKVLSVTQTEDAGYTLEIAHSDNFVTVLSGLDFVYASQGDSVYTNIPVGYIKEDLSLCFKNGETIITDYEITDNSVVWGK